MSKKQTKKEKSWSQLIQLIMNPPKRYNHQKVTYGRERAIRKKL